MRRLLFLIAAALSVTLVHAQDAENVGNGAQLSIIPRVDLNPYLGYNGPTEFGFSNTGIYSLLEGSFADNFSYTGYFHFASADGFADLYQYPFNPGMLSWVNVLNLTYAPSDFAFSVGKNCMSIGVFEYNDWDHDCYYDINSTFWNNFNPYQWGGDISYYFADEAWATVQVTASPFTERPFQDGLVSASALLTDQTGDFSYIMSANLVGVELGQYMKMFCTGLKYDTGKFSASLDAMGRKYCRHWEDTYGLTLGYNPGDKFHMRGKLNVENVHEDDWEYALSCNERVWGGFIFEYFPLRDSDALRLHAVITHMPFAGQVSACFGATYNFQINL